MLKKKSNKSGASAEDQELIKRVDAIMNPGGQTKTAGLGLAADQAKTAEALPPAAASKGTVTKVKNKPAEPPIVIKLADEPKLTAKKPVATKQVPTSDIIEDSATDKAVDEIVASEDNQPGLTSNHRIAAKPSVDPPKNTWIWISLGLLVGLALGAAAILSAR